MKDLGIKGFGIVFALGLVIVVFSFFSRPGYPTDAELEARFNQNRQDFESLLKLFLEDTKLTYVTKRTERALIEYEFDPVIPTERFERYQQLLSKVGAYKISRNRGSNDVYLHVWSSSNLFIGGQKKDFVYDPDFSGTPAISLDEIYKSGTDASQHKKLDGSWYLYLDVW